MPDENPSATMMALVIGFQRSQAVSVAAQLGIADLLNDGPRTSDELAAATSTDPDALYRLLRALSAIGVFSEEDGRTFSLTELGECLRSDDSRSVKDWAAYIGSTAHWNSWGMLAHSVRTGENGFQHLYDTDVWTYREQRPELSRLFDQAMTAVSRARARDVVRAYDFSAFGCIADIAGGNGYLLAEVLRATPDARGILFDQPHVVAGAADILKQAGVKDRCETVGGSFFESVPGGADAYMLKNIIHDWADPQATAILKVCREAIPASGKLLIVEMGIREPNRGALGKFSDLNMLAVPGGRERTSEEMSDLLNGADFNLDRTIDTSPDGMQIFQASPA